MISDKDVLLIVDGHNLLFQMFYGMPSRIVNKDGKPIQGIIGFVGALLKIIKQTVPQYIVVLFDGEHENLRTKVLPEYKENRIDYSLVAEEENPFSQLQDIYKALDFMGIRHCEIEDVETDDVIASYVYKYGQKMQIIVSSWDSDFFQLISENVKVLRYRGKNTVVCDTEFVGRKFCIKPEIYADFKAMVGDRADNIKGAEKIGIKTASMLLQRFGNLEEIIKNTDAIQRKCVRESIVANKERLLVNYKVIKLTEGTEIPFQIEELRYSDDEIKTMDVLQGIGVK